MTDYTLSDDRVPFCKLVQGTGWDLPYFCIVLVLFATYNSVQLVIWDLQQRGRVPMTERMWLNEHIPSAASVGEKASQFLKYTSGSGFWRCTGTKAAEDQVEVGEDIPEDEYWTGVAGRPLTAIEKQAMESDIARNNAVFDGTGGLPGISLALQWLVLPIAAVGLVGHFALALPWRYSGSRRYVPFALVVLLVLNWVCYLAVGVGV